MLNIVFKIACQAHYGHSKPCAQRDVGAGRTPLWASLDGEKTRMGWAQVVNFMFSVGLALEAAMPAHVGFRNKTANSVYLNCRTKQY